MKPHVRFLDGEFECPRQPGVEKGQKVKVEVDFNRVDLTTIRKREYSQVLSIYDI